MRKYFLLFLIIISLTPFTIADILIATEQPIYNIGDRIKVFTSALDENNFEGLLKITLNCNEYRLDYFLSPISLEDNFRTAITVPDIIATKQMLGNCSMLGSLTTYENSIVEEKASNSFSVTKQLNIVTINPKLSSLPGETIQIVGLLNDAYGINVLKALTKVTLDNESYIFETRNGKLNFTIHLSNNIKSGKHIIYITASDDYDNIAQSEIELNIMPIQSYIKTQLSSDKLNPGSKIAIIPTLYDQADDVVNLSLEIELVSPTGNKIFKKVAQSNEGIEYEFNQYAEPGTYILISTYKTISTTSFVNITTIREVNLNYQNGTAIIENVGNVLFEDSFNFILESEFKKYTITKKLKVEPGKVVYIDLSKEVPSGVYNVFVAAKEGILPIAKNLGKLESEDFSTQGLSNIMTDAIATNVLIQDNRPFYKKLASGFSHAAGLVVGVDGLLAKNPIVAPLIVFIIILLIVVRYAGKPLIRLFRRKKDDNK